MPLSQRPSLRRALAPGFALALLCAGIFLAPRSLDAGLTAAAAPQAAVDTIRELPLITNDIVYDPATKLIYASVPGRVGAGGNSIMPIDPSQSAAGTPVFVGSEPRRMALSGDGQYIYVGLDGAGAVRRYDVAAHAPDLFFDIGGVGTRDIVVMPGDPHSVAVSRMNVGLAPGLASIFDEGVARPSAAGIDQGNTGLYIEPSSSPSLLYGTNGVTLQRISVTPSGLSVVKSTPVTSGGDMKFSGGRLYMPRGQVIDPETETVVGTYDLEQPGFVGTTFLVLPDPEFDRVYFLVQENGNYVLRVYQKSNFQFIDKRVIAPAFAFQYSSLVRWGTNGLAFRTDRQVFLIQTPLVPSPEPLPPAPPSPTPTPTPTPVPTPAPGELRILALPANDLVIDPRSQTLYASVATTGGAAADSVTPIDPVSGTTGTPVPIGPAPNRMAISDDGRFIYVGIDGANAVRRYDVDAHAAGAQFSIVPEGSSGQWRAHDLAVVPGHPENVVVARRSVSSNNATAVLYNDGVQAPGTDIFHASDVLEFSSNPSVLYSHSNVIGSYSFQKMAVASCGVGAATSVERLTGSFTWDFKLDNGLLYTSTGQVIDPEAGTRVGVFPAGTDVVNGLVLPDSKAGRVYFITGLATSAEHALWVFDQKTFTEIGHLRLPGPTGGVISGLVRWGTNGLAYRTSDNQVVLIQHPLVAPQTLSPAPAPTPASLTFNIAGRVEQIPSFGASPLAGATVSLTGSQNATAPIDADGKFSFSNVAPCGDYTVTPSATLTDFTPPSRSYAKLVTNQTANFDAFVRRFSLFASPTVAETGGQFFVSVMRTGADKGPATIDYATSDGTASERSDYTPAAGTLRFATNETTKFIFIHITNDALNEGPETLTLAFSNPAGALPPAATSLTLTINSEDSADGPSPVAGDSFNAPFFVRQHYLDFLGRAPDAAGASFWAGQTTNCGNADLLVCRINVSAAFFLSIEFQQTGFLVYKTHGAAFGTRRVGGAVPLRLREFLPDTQTIGAGVIVNQGAWEAQLEANKAAFFEEFVSRAAFVAAYPASLSAAQYVDALNANAGGALSTTERNQLVADLNAGTKTRGQVLRAVAENDTFSAREKNRAFVLMQYFGYLRRNPDDAPEEKRNYDGFNFWLGKLNDNGGNFVRAEMVKAFITSDEYRKRFGQ